MLETAVRDWLELKKGETDASEDDAQRRLHTAAADCLGAIASGKPCRPVRISPPPMVLRVA